MSRYTAGELASVDQVHANASKVLHDIAARVRADFAIEDRTVVLIRLGRELRQQDPDALLGLAMVAVYELAAKA